MAIDVLDTIRPDVERILPRVGSGSEPPHHRQNGPGGSGGDGSNGLPARPVANAIVAMLLFLGADLMLFAGFIGAFIVFRFGAESWPPPGQPTLPLNVTTANTVVLLLSGVTMAVTLRLLKIGSPQRIKKGLLVTTILGIVFLSVQGYEWVRLVKFGLTLSKGVFGSTFYTLIGCHAAHVAGAVIWLSVVLLRYSNQARIHVNGANLGIKLIAMYWFLVVALWPILFVLVYLK